jgi:hypothetical protein
MYTPNINYIKKNIEELYYSRLAGSKDEEKAFKYIESELKQYGFDIDYHKFHDEWIEPYESYFTYQNNDYPIASTMVYTYMESALKWGFSDSLDTNIKGIISNDRKTKAIRIYESINYEYLDDSNAIAIIFLNKINPLEIACKQLAKNKYLPCFFIDPELNIKPQENDVISIHVKTHTIQKEFKNMIIKKTNNTSSAPIIFGAHIDSFPGSPGASDNAFGVSMCMDIASQCADCDDFWFTIFTAEEVEGKGSKAFVEQYLIEKNIKPALYVNIDSGVENGSGNINIKISPKSSAHIVSTIVNEGYKIEHEAFSSNDSVPFSSIGVPVFWIWASSPYRAHSIEDTASNIDNEQMKQIAYLYSKVINKYVK